MAPIDAARSRIPSDPRAPRPFSEETARTIDAEVQQIIGESHDEATRLLTKYRRQLDALAQALLARETLDEQEILEVTGLPPASALKADDVPVRTTSRVRRSAASPADVLQQEREALRDRRDEV